MKRFLNLFHGGIAAVALGFMAMSGANASDRLADGAVQSGVPRTTLALPDGTSIHMMPTVALQSQIDRALGARSLGNVAYHGGRIMRKVNIYAIFWAPPTLQTGAATAIPPSYRSILNGMLGNYAGHSIANINTQYSETIGALKYYHSGLGSFAASVVDTGPYPASGCTDTSTPGNCITDTQIRAKIESVRVAQGWGTGYDKIYLLFTSSGEGSCITAGSTSCSYTQYCAYHGWYGSSTNPVIYSNEPYGNNSVCQTTSLLPNPGTVDSAATAARHEISEATSDPQLDAWWDSSTGEETSDKCNFNYGTTSWKFVSPNFLANYFWGGRYFLLQQEYSNHKSNCTQEGP